MRANAQRPQHVVTNLERHTKEATVPATLIGLSMRRREPLIVGGVRHEKRLASGYDNAGEALARLDPRRGHGGPRIAPHAHEHEIIAVHDPDPH